MVYGITGNTRKENLWQPVADLVAWLLEHGVGFWLQEHVARGLTDRQLLDRGICETYSQADLTQGSDVILSFGGDGTMLTSAHEVGTSGTPILGVNIGRLGFLADIEVGQVQRTIERLERGEYRIESRMVLEAQVENHVTLDRHWALNEFVLDRSGVAGLITIDVTVDGEPLNVYWTDGLIMATPTGSTAYSLSAGGPIMVPGCGAMILTPIAPHTLTVRPLVLPETAVVEARVSGPNLPYVLAADGRSILIDEPGIRITVRKAAHQVNLVKLPEQHYFQTLRSKLMWGLRHPG
jgi:NAD+ kinase